MRTGVPILRSWFQGWNRTTDTGVRPAEILASLIELQRVGLAKSVVALIFSPTG